MKGSLVADRTIQTREVFAVGDLVEVHHYTAHGFVWIKGIVVNFHMGHYGVELEGARNQTLYVAQWSGDIRKRGGE
jgi:hypothetical protein